MISKIHQRLLSMEDKKYLKFNSKIILQKDYPMIGIRLPMIKDYAKELMKENRLPEFKDKYYEEIVLHGICIGRYRCDFSEKISLIDSFLPLINDWSICDSFVPTLKDIKKHLEEYYPYVKGYLKSDREFFQRFGFIVLLDYYRDEKYLKDIFGFIRKTKYNGYYSKMGAAWLLSYLFIAFYEETVRFISENKLDEFVLLKGIQKAIESYRISDENKAELKAIKSSYK